MPSGRCGGGLREDVEDRSSRCAAMRKADAMQSCPRFRRCSAPLCPLHGDLRDRDGWWTDEAVCRNPDLQKHPMIRRQKRLARLRKSRKSASNEFHSAAKLTVSRAMPQKRSQRRGTVKVVL